MSFEQHLVLQRFLHRELGVHGLEDLRSLLAGRPEGRVEEGGASHFLQPLIEREGRRVSAELLEAADGRVMALEADFAAGRGEGFRFRYFQYLALLYTEVYLTRLVADPKGLLAELRAFAGEGAFEEQDLRRLALFMATGSGKTLMMHAQVRQVLHHLEHGRHPEALVDALDGRRLFDNVILVTPGEGLSDQHLDELARTPFLRGARLVEQPGATSDLFVRDEALVKVVEIHKLAEEASGEGVSIALESLGGHNLVLVDEGHKGAGSEAKVWKQRQQRLAEQGFLLEYSATFKQAVNAAPKKARTELAREYGRHIVFDYSFRHFHADGHGKDFEVLNLQRGTDAHARELLLGGLLLFYRQRLLYDRHPALFRRFQVAPPLWVFLGTRVSKAGKTDNTKAGKQERSDVATVVAFLRAFLEEPGWAKDAIRRCLDPKSEFVDGHRFRERLGGLVESDAEALYEAICSRMFHGRGALELWEVADADGEIGLRTSAPDRPGEAPWFGVINIGDVRSFEKHAEEALGLEVKTDRFGASLFREVDDDRSTVNLLVGARRFVEGWSSWRVSMMGLLNIGKNEGSLVIQLFGRGVRLKGLGMSLKRSPYLPPEDRPGTEAEREALAALERLSIFGWNADYVEHFRGAIEDEGVMEEITLPARVRMPEGKVLYAPAKPDGFRADGETWTLDPARDEVVKGLHVSLDRTPRLQRVRNGEVVVEEATASEAVDFRLDRNWNLVDANALYASWLAHKTRQGLHHVFLPFGAMREILAEQCALLVPKDEATDPEVLQHAATQLLCRALDRFAGRKRRRLESEHLVPEQLRLCEPEVAYRVRVRADDAKLLDEVRRLRDRPEALYDTDLDGGLRRLHLDRHLFDPLLLEPDDDRMDSLTLFPPGLNPDEAELLKMLRDWWVDHAAEEPWSQCALHVLRNPSQGGVSFFRGVGFNPDFVLWLESERTGWTDVVFLEPHGLVHGGLAEGTPNGEKLKVFRDDLPALSDRPDFEAQRIRLSGFVLSSTEPRHLFVNKSWRDLEAEHPTLLRQDERCVARIFERLAPRIV
ncbi:MAG: DEAD/DEAH box helicase family protein [Myxococcota bacterium]